MNILIVDDHALIAEKIGFLIQGIDSSIQTFKESNYEAALNILNTEELDLCLFDINLEEKQSGFDLAEIARNKSIPFLFISSYQEGSQVSTAVDLKPVGYVVKPIDNNNFRINLQLILDKINSETLTIIIGKSEYRFKISEILYIKSDGNYCDLYTSSSKTFMRNKLKNWVDYHPDLVQIHRSYVINKSKIQSKNKKEIILENGAVLPISSTLNLEDL